MRRLGPALLAAAALAAPAAAFWWGSSAQSRRLDRTITLDGSDEDWKGIERDDSDGLSFAFVDDDRSLYMLVAPHTKWTKEQFAGTFGQDLTLWLDPQARKNKRLGLKLRPPEGSAPGARRQLELVGVDSATAAGSGLEAVMGPKEGRGVMEARIPLSLLGPGPVRKMSVGLEASAPAKPVARVHDARSQRRESDYEDELFEPVDLWVRVTLARPEAR